MNLIIYNDLVKIIYGYKHDLEMDEVLFQMEERFFQDNDATFTKLLITHDFSPYNYIKSHYEFPSNSGQIRKDFHNYMIPYNYNFFIDIPEIFYDYDCNCDLCNDLNSEIIWKHYVNLKTVLLEWMNINIEFYYHQFY